ncbi:GNAT family N-acetyltransferase [uncultured Polaribacter sp.]|uniref:GNAT family N-acetyltransferase n=1 Tax=uncultured Polaribacter sp. TaxID=174711 RepID=UPI00262945EA|nr:GNAT family N-acetyltransferase [uncultured Polaribacter sp.]
MSNYIIKYSLPSPNDYSRLRQACGFGKVSEVKSKQSLKYSLYSISIYSSNQLIGFGRVLGDGVLYFYISDVMVPSLMQGKKIGRLIMENIIMYINKKTSKLSTVCTIVMPNKEAFYKNYGLKTCPNNLFGHGMIHP